MVASMNNIYYRPAPTYPNICYGLYKSIIVRANVEQNGLMRKVYLVINKTFSSTKHHGVLFTH